MLRERVLLVDDEPQMLVALEDMLSDQFAIVSTTSPDDALVLLQHERDIAVVVTDQRMPKMTGDQLLAKLGPECQALRIMVTGFADLNAVIRAVNEGSIFAYITKPWDPDDLRAKVNHAAERFRSAKELLDEQQVLRDLLVHSPDGIYLKDRELRFVQVNRAFAAHSGGRQEVELLAKRVADVLPDHALAAAIELDERRVLEVGEPLLDVLRQYPLHGGRWFSETRAPIRGKAGDVVGLLGISRDVTERMHSQHALSQSEARLRAQTQLLHAILDNLAEGVIVADGGGNFLLFNRQARQLLGVEPEGLNARGWASACGAYQLDRKTPLTPDDDPLRRAMRGESWTELELFVQNEKIAGSHVVMTGTPLVSPEGEVVGGIALVRDVSVHRALEARLVQAHKLEAVGRLAGGVAHDFNNLLSVIQGCTGLLLRSIGPGQQRDDLTQILTAAERAANLTKQLMLFSRQQSAQLQVLQLNDVLPQLQAMLARVLGERITLRLELSPELGLVEVDRSQLEQLIINLALNARDAMPSGGRLVISTRNVDVSERDARESPALNPGRFAVLRVADTGVGMDAQTQARMYDPFYTTKAIGKGVGLGLATVYGIVRQSGGFLHCESHLGHGTSFEVYLPLTRTPTAAQAQDDRPQPQAAPVASTILLVEDEDAVRMVARRVLRTRGYHVHEARTADEAERIYQREAGQIDLLITDIVMPERSGTELAEALRLIAPGLRILFMSGYAGAAAPTLEASRTGRFFLEKPFTPSSLLAKVDEALKPRD
ncbi:MAG: response regulator [Polyangiales bacterium]